MLVEDDARGEVTEVARRAGDLFVWPLELIDEAVDIRVSFAR